MALLRDGGENASAWRAKKDLRAVDGRTVGECGGGCAVTGCAITGCEEGNARGGEEGPVELEEAEATGKGDQSEGVTGRRSLRLGTTMEIR